VSEKRSAENCGVDIEGLLPDEQRQLLGAIAGCYWVSVEDGRLRVLPALQQPPAPAEDKKMMPYWSSEMQRDGFLQRKIFGNKKDWPPFSPSFIIQHLCGYNWTQEYYESTAKQLEGFGFECMRSRRGIDGKFWEIWFLPGLWAAEGKFKEFLKGAKPREKEQIEKAIQFLCHYVSFGSLDVVAQRAAMPVPD